MMMHVDAAGLGLGCRPARHEAGCGCRTGADRRRDEAAPAQARRLATANAGTQEMPLRLDHVSRPSSARLIEADRPASLARRAVVPMAAGSMGPPPAAALFLPIPNHIGGLGPIMPPYLTAPPDA